MTACQTLIPKKPCQLIISEFMSISRSLGTVLYQNLIKYLFFFFVSQAGVLRVNPFDLKQVSDAIHQVNLYILATHFVCPSPMV